jgi:hypothetical protein
MGFCAAEIHHKISYRIAPFRLVEGRIPRHSCLTVRHKSLDSLFGAVSHSRDCEMTLPDQSACQADQQKDPSFDLCRRISIHAGECQRSGFVCLTTTKRCISRCCVRCNSRTLWQAVKMPPRARRQKSEKEGPRWKVEWRAISLRPADHKAVNIQT